FLLGCCIIEDKRKTSEHGWKLLIVISFRRRFNSHNLQNYWGGGTNSALVGEGSPLSLYVDRWETLHSELAQAHVFLSAEEAGAVVSKRLCRSSILAKEPLAQLRPPTRRYESIDRQCHNHTGAEQPLSEVPCRGVPGQRRCEEEDLGDQSG